MMLRRITLRQLTRMVKKNRNFFVDVLTSPQKALAEKHLTLSPVDLRKLQRWLRRRHCITGKKFAMVLLKVKKIDDWPQVN